MSRYSTTIWKPKTSVNVNLLHAVEVGGIGWLLDETITNVAARTELIPSVAMKELTLSFTTTIEFTMPTRSPKPIPAAMVGPTAQPWSLRRTTERMPDTLAVAP